MLKIVGDKEMSEDELLIPKERYDSVIFIGVKRDGSVEFIKVYGSDKEKTLEILNRFFHQQNLYPQDYLIVDEGYEDVSGKAVISTRTEEKLSAYLSRLGLKLVSNGVLYLKGTDKLYQITVVTNEFLELLKKLSQRHEERKTQEELEEIEPYIDLSALPPEEIPREYLSSLELLELREDSLIINEAEIDIDKILEKCVKGQVKIPRYLEFGDGVLQVFDEKLHEKVSSKVEWVLVKTPLIFWDSCVDDLDEFKFKKVEENVYSVPLFFKAYKGYLILSEPPIELVKKLRKIKHREYVKFSIGSKYYRIPVDFTLVVETKDSQKYNDLGFPVIIRFPKFDEDLMREMLQRKFGVELPFSVVRRIPREYRTMVAFKNLVKLFEKLKARAPEKENLELLKEALLIMIGEH